MMKPMSLQDTLKEIDSCYALAGRGYAGNEFWSSWFLDSYMEGLGGPYWRKQFFLFDLFIKRDVSYFHTSTGQGGSPIDFDSLLLATRLAPPLESIAHAVQVIPNPAHGAFQLHLSAELAHAPVRIHMYAPDGRVVKSLPADGGSVVDIDVQGLPPGIYLVVVQAEGCAKARKVILW